MNTWTHVVMRTCSERDTVALSLYPTECCTLWHQLCPRPSLRLSKKFACTSLPRVPPARVLGTCPHVCVLLTHIVVSSWLSTTRKSRRRTLTFPSSCVKHRGVQLVCLFVWVRTHAYNTQNVERKRTQKSATSSLARLPRPSRS